MWIRPSARDGKCGPSKSNPTPGQSCEPEGQTLTTYVVNVGRAGKGVGTVPCEEVLDGLEG